jgi:hypothetical protein
MRLTLLFSLLLVLLVRNLAPAAPLAPGDGPTKKVTLHLQATPFGKAVAELFSGTGQEYKISPELTQRPVTLNLENVPFQTAFRALLAQVGALYRIESPVGTGAQRRQGGHVWMIMADDRKQRKAAATPEPLVATLAPGAGALEIVVPAALKRQVTITAVSSPTRTAFGETELSGKVRLAFPNGMALEVQHAQVQVTDAGSDRERHVRITPLPAPAAAK